MFAGAPVSETEAPVRSKVLYIAGTGRSGSTVLDQLLGCIRGFTSTGEIRWLFDAGFGRNQLCTCGRPLRECPFWTEVMRRAYPDDSLEDLVRLKRQVDRRHHLLWLAFPRLRAPRYRRRLRHYVEVFGRLFPAIRAVSGARVIVDSSKHPCYSFILRDMDSIDLRVVHLVRDSRAVAYSSQRRKKKLSIPWKDEYMPREGPVVRSLKWAGVNAFSDLLAGLGDRYMRVRYEDLMDDAHGTLEAIAQHAGEPRPDLSFLHAVDGIEMTEHHTALGNPNRFAGRPVRLSKDTEWEEKLGALDRATVNLITWPWLRRYRYF